MKITDLFGCCCVWVFFEIISEIDLAGKGVKIFFRDPHSRIMKVTARKQNIELIFVELVNLVADQEITKLDYGDGVKLGMICIFGEQKLIIRQNSLKHKDAVGKSLVKITVQFAKAEFKGKTVGIIRHFFIPLLV